ncbi:hypothetical protein HHI36_001723 [Cryptolaemus montrouzieri]|uniref:Uncharacterized protein n=1 Tax=Cryptolaemus montrouzieri TaxID=559131 RepID=A0ABD2P973_9CUCU
MRRWNLTGDIIGIGDFNIDLKSDTYYAKKCVKLINNNGLHLLVKYYTKITKDSAALIDYVITNNKNIKPYVNLTPKILDYSIITWELEEVRENKVKTYLHRRSYKSNDVDNFQRTLLKTVWNNNSPDVNFLAAKFLEPTKEFMSNHCPTVKIPVDESRPVKQWLNEEIEDIIKKRDRSYQIVVFTKSHQKWMEYKTLRNQVISRLRSSEKSFYFNILINYQVSLKISRAD